MAIVSTELLDRLTAQQNIPVALAYGRHLVAGNVILRDDDSVNDITTLFVALGEGEWGSVEELRLNGLVLDESKFHFHPGKDGETGTDGVTGDQKIDAWFPAGIQGLTFSRTAYVVIRSDSDIEAPTSEFLVLGKYKTRKVRTYDASGVETGFLYSANPVWYVLDVLLLREPATRINFATFAAEAAFCDALITVNGVEVPRFESHVAFPRQTGLGQALQAILNTCRGYLFDDGGKVSIRIDAARAAAHTFTDAAPSNIVDGSFRYWTRDIGAATNRLRLEFRDLENDFAFTDVPVEREWAQVLLDKVNEKKLNLGNLTQQQARRVGEYFVNRAIDARKMVSLTGLQDSVHLLPGDRVDLQHTLAPWSGLKAFEVVSVGEQPSEERELLLQEYDAAAFTDSADPNQDLEGGVIISTLARPPLPSFVVGLQQDGFARFLGIGFPVLDNSTKFITTATFTAFHRSDIANAATTLGVDADALTTSWTVASGAALAVDGLYAINGEIIKVETIDGNVVTLARAQKGSTAAAHVTGDTLWAVSSTGFTFAFPFNAFSGLAGSLGGSWEGQAELNSQRIVAAECFVTNRKGDSPTATNNYGALQYNGLRTFNGGQFDFVIDGVLEITSTRAPEFQLDRAMPVKDVILTTDKNKGPLGDDIQVNVVVGGVDFITGIQIDDGKEIGSTAAFAELGFIPADTPFTVHVTKVGTTFPGERLVASVRF